MRSHLDRIRDWKTPARDANYCVLKLAGFLQITPRQLERYFLEQFACCPKVWLEHLMVRDAKDFLRRGMMVKEVAERLGFKNATHFSRAFRRHEGLAPLAMIAGNRRARPKVAKRSEMSGKGL